MKSLGRHSIAFAGQTNHFNVTDRENKFCTDRLPARALKCLKSPAAYPTTSIFPCYQRDSSAKCRLHHDSSFPQEDRIACQCRRNLLLSSLSLAAGFTTLPSAPAHAGEEVCLQCRGSGDVPCGLCDGSGRWLSSYQNGIPVRDKCPQCEGRGQLRCVLCLGTGLRNTSGLLRGPAVKEGRLRIRGDGSIEILDCDYFPATRGKQCRGEGKEGSDTNLLTEERSLT